MGLIKPAACVVVNFIYTIPLTRCQKINQADGEMNPFFFTTSKNLIAATYKSTLTGFNRLIEKRRKIWLAYISIYRGQNQIRTSYICNSGIMDAKFFAVIKQFVQICKLEYLEAAHP